MHTLTNVRLPHSSFGTNDVIQALTSGLYEGKDGSKKGNNMARDIRVAKARLIWYKRGQCRLIIYSTRWFLLWGMQTQEGSHSFFFSSCSGLSLTNNSLITNFLFFFFFFFFFFYRVTSFIVMKIVSLLSYVIFMVPCLISNVDYGFFSHCCVIIQCWWLLL